MFPELNDKILRQSEGLKYLVADIAPSDESSLFNSPKTLVIWAGASENTIFRDARVNWAFRALHDQLHRQSGLYFNVEHEIELGRRQASQFDGLLADLVYLEVAGQAMHFRDTGCFVENQVTWTINQLRVMGYRI